MSSFLGGSTTTTIILLTTLPFLLVALFLVFKARAGQRQIKASQGWAVTTGTVLLATLEARRSSNSDGGTSTSYYPNVVYEYEVNGQRYRSNTLHLGMAVGRGSYRAVEQQISRYQPGSLVEVFYNPDAPSQAVLERTAPANRWLLLAVVIILAIIIGTLVLIFGAFGMADEWIRQLTH